MYLRRAGARLLPCYPQVILHLRLISWVYTLLDPIRACSATWSAHDLKSNPAGSITAITVITHCWLRRWRCSQRLQLVSHLTSHSLVFGKAPPCRLLASAVWTPPGYVLSQSRTSDSQQHLLRGKCAQPAGVPGRQKLRAGRHRLQGGRRLRWAPPSTTVSLRVSSTWRLSHACRLPCDMHTCIWYNELCP